MTEWRPLWDGMPEERRKAGITEIEKAIALHPKTDREQRYIAALNGYLHADPAQADQAVHAYSDSMGTLSKAYPDDVEAQAFYGLALAVSIGKTDPVGDARKALAVLEPGFEAHPDHPGFAHYIIHTCDNPQIAREGLAAAKRYALIAPASAHALHMPGHIFSRLGMWPEDIESNKASVVASEYAEKHHLSGVTHEMHAYEFLLYAYLQQGDDADAKAILNNTDALAAHLSALPGIANDGMGRRITYIQVEYPSIYHSRCTIGKRFWIYLNQRTLLLRPGITVPGRGPSLRDIFATLKQPTRPQRRRNSMPKQRTRNTPLLAGKSKQP
jgi:hypothetical protein